MSSISQLILITTANLQANRDDDLRRLSKSVDAFRHARRDVMVQHQMLLQCCDDIPSARARLGFSDEMILTASPKQLPLSVARNRMLDIVLGGGTSNLSSALIAFPDDDAWFPAGSLEYIHDRFAYDPDLNFWFCRYGTDAAMPVSVVEKAAKLQDAISRASSNTIFLRGNILQAVGGFDEGLGLGTPAKSGEDTEFAMRAYFASPNVCFSTDRMIGHRDFDPAIRAKYFGGTLVALGRYATRSPASFAAFVRKILVGCALMVKSELRPSEFLRAWKMYFSNRRAPNFVSPTGRPSDVQYPLKTTKRRERQYA